MTDPKVLQIVDRILAVLKSIVEGDEYFYSVGENVVKGLRLHTEAPGFPFDMVFLGSDHEPPKYCPDNLVYRYPTIAIAAYVDSENGDPVTKLLRHLADVQKAIEADLKSGESGSLGQLVAWGHLAGVGTDEGELGLGFSGFRQDLEICVAGTWGDL